MHMQNATKQYRQFRRQLWISLVLPAFLGALIVRALQTLVRIKIRSLAQSVSPDEEMDGENRPAEKVTLPRAEVQNVPVTKIPAEPAPSPFTAPNSSLPPTK